MGGAGGAAFEGPAFEGPGLAVAFCPPSSANSGLRYNSALSNFGAGTLIFTISYTSAPKASVGYLVARWDGEQGTYLRILLIIQTVPQQVPEIAQRPLDRVRHRFLLTLFSPAQHASSASRSYRKRGADRGKRTLSIAMPLDFAFSKRPKPTSSWKTPSRRVTLTMAVTPTLYRWVWSLKST